MPRKARIILRNTPHHIVQRGHNRKTVFIAEADYRYYLSTLREYKQKFGVRVYSYCLMTNHVHLILDPCDDERSIGKLMKRLAGRLTRRVNCQESRTGSLWDGRYKSSPIETDTYLLACSRYVELNPVRAGMVEQPANYIWCSYRQKVGLDDAWIDEDACYLGLSESGSERRRRYAGFVLQTGTARQDEIIRNSYRNGWLTGTTRFIDEVESRTRIRAENKGPGRPAKKK